MEKKPIVVDANILISALIGGECCKILWVNKYTFISTEFTISEVEKYIPLISKKSGVPEQEILFALHLLPLSIFSREAYSAYLSQAKMLIEQVDPKDVDVLALALANDCPLWSHDAHFDNINEIKLLKIIDFLAN